MLTKLLKRKLDLARNVNKKSERTALQDKEMLIKYNLDVFLIPYSQNL